MFNFYDRLKRAWGNGFFYLAGLLSFFVGVNVWWVSVDNRVPYNDPPWHFISSLRIYELFHDFSFEKMRDVAFCAFHPPFTGIMVRPFYIFFGQNLDGAVIAMNLIFLPILVVGVYKIVFYFSRKLLLSILACGVVLSYPGVLIASRFYLLEIPLAAMTTIAFYFLLRTREFQLRKPSIIFGIVSGLALLTKTIYIVFMALPFLYLSFKLSTRKQWKNCILALGACFLISGFWYIPTQKQFFANFFLLVYIYAKYIGKIFIFVGLGIIIPFLLRKKLSKRIINFLLLPLFVIVAVVFFMHDYYFLHFFLTYISGIVNNVMGFSGVLFFLIGFGMAATSLTRDKKMVLFWAAALFFISWPRYLVPALPASAIITVLGIDMLRQALRRWVIFLLWISCVVSFTICTWDIPILPVKLDFGGENGIFLFNRKPMLSNYGPPQAIARDTEWRLEKLFDVLKNEKIKQNTMVWLISDHTYYNAATLNYLSRMKREKIFFSHLIGNPTQVNIDELLKSKGNKYFLDLEGFFYPADHHAVNKLKAIRDSLSQAGDKFRIISKERLPDELTVILYKRIDER